MRMERVDTSGIRHWKAAASTTFLVQQIAVVHTSGGSKGYVDIGQAATGLRPVGLVAQACDNSTGSNGDRVVSVMTGHDQKDFLLDNSANSDLITQADVMSVCYIAGPRTVAKTDGSGTRSEMGTVVEVLPNGKVWVQMKPYGATL